MFLIIPFRRYACASNVAASVLVISVLICAQARSDEKTHLVAFKAGLRYPVEDLAVSPSGELLAVGMGTSNSIQSAGAIAFFRLPGLDFVSEIPKTRYATHFVFLHDETLLTRSVGKRGTLTRWDPQKNESLGEFTEIKGYGTATLDGKMFAIGTETRGELALWDAVNHREVRRIQYPLPMPDKNSPALVRERTFHRLLPPRPILALAFDRQAERFAVFEGAGRIVKVWNISDGSLLATTGSFPEPNTGARLSFSDDGKNLAVAASWSDHGAHMNKFTCWSISPYGELGSRELTGRVERIEAQNHGDLIATVAGVRVRLWRLPSLEEMPLSEEVSIGGVTCVKFSTDGKLLIVGDGQKRVQVWRVPIDD